MIEIKEFVEQTVTSNQNQPISASKILEYVLGENNGDLAKSLRDTAIFLKFTARNDLSTGKFVGYSRNQMLIRDGYQAIFWTNMGELALIVN